MNIIDLSARAKALGLNLIINRDADKQYEFCKGTRVIWSTRRMQEADRFIKACTLNKQTLVNL